MRFAILCSIALFASSAAAATLEQVAVDVGKFAGAYQRAQFLCLAAGIAMPKLADSNPRFWDQATRNLKKYPEFFTTGFERGAFLANDLIKDYSDDMNRICTSYRTDGINRR